MKTKRTDSGSTATFHEGVERGGSAPEGGQRSLLVYGATSSMRFALPAVGDAVIGRGDDCAVVLDDRAASRRHACIRCDIGTLFVEDLKSHNGTLLNGKPLTGLAPLRPGDSISIGETSLVVLAPAHAQVRRVLDPLSTLRRIEEHADRSRHEAYIAAVVVFALPGGAPLEASATSALLGSLEGREELGELDDGQRVIVAPLEEESIERRIEAWTKALGSRAKEISIGVASAPSDGVEAGALLAAARAAAGQAEGGTVKHAGETYVERKLAGDATVLLAEPSMLRAYELIDRLARGVMPVLVRGETGSGKELAALALHVFSSRSKGPYRVVNCAAVAESLLESELFGHERGAFTGATATRVGHFESAHGGTLFLDEIGELSPSAQAKLLRVLETGKVTRVGSTRETAVDVRLVAATHKNLPEEVEQGRFRKDLYFRVGAATVLLPPLRERPREIPLLARIFLSRACVRMGRAPLEIAPLSMQVLLGHPWPGNARELRNVVEYAAAVTDGMRVEPWHLPPLSEQNLIRDPDHEPLTVPTNRDPDAPSTEPSPAVLEPTRLRTLAEEIRDLERQRIIEALEAGAGIQTKAAERLGMPVRTLFAKLRAHAIDPKEYTRK